MKKKLWNASLVACLIGLIALSNCANDRGSKEQDYNSDNNHANTPPGAPASEYPGNNSDSTSNASHIDTIHHE